MKNIRKIIHIDMDAFFAAVEVRENPQLRGKPVIVGSPPNSRGVVSTCSYEARKYGIHSAMPTTKAYRLCPHAIFIKPHFELYVRISRQIHEIFYDYTDLVEPLSIDEAFLDVTSNKKDNPSATLIAKEIKERIKQKTDLTASAGVSYNKFLAKIASDLDKPDGLVVITPQKAKSALQKLPIGKFYGIGKVSEKKMHRLGIHTGADLLRWSREELVRHFGKVGNFYYDCVHGIDKREVQATRIRKSLGMERTFSEDIADITKMYSFLRWCATEVSTKLEQKKIKGKTLTLKLRYEDFSSVSKSRTLEFYFDNCATIETLGKELLDELRPQTKKVRLLGLSVSSLIHYKEQITEQLYLPFYTKL
jgi:DNA polymerase-4